MFQQIAALIIVIYFLSRLFWQKRKGQISSSEFIFWLIFWIAVGGAVTMLKWIDQLVSNLGFSSSGINVLIYISVLILFYLIFKLQLKISRIEKDLTKLVRNDAINTVIEKKN